MKNLLIGTGLIAIAGATVVYIKKLKKDIHELEITHQKEAGMIAQYSNEVNELKEQYKKATQELMSNVLTDAALCRASREELEKLIERSKEIIDENKKTK